MTRDFSLLIERVLTGVTTVFFEYVDVWLKNLLLEPTIEEIL